MIKYVFTALCKCHDIMKWMNKAEQDGIKSDHIKKDLFSVKKQNHRVKLYKERPHKTRICKVRSHQAKNIGKIIKSATSCNENL